MKTYLLTLFGVCVVSAVIRVISPEGSTKKYIELLCSVCVIAAVAMPAVKAITGFSDYDFDISLEENNKQNYDEIYNGNLLYESRAAAEELMKNELAALLSVSPESLRVRLGVSQGTDGAAIDSVTVYISAGAITADPAIIKKYVGEITTSECQITYEVFDEN